MKWENSYNYMGNDYSDCHWGGIMINYDKLKKMDLKESVEYLKSLEESYNIESRESIPDIDYMNDLIEKSGYLEEHIRVLKRDFESWILSQTWAIAILEYMYVKKKICIVNWNSWNWSW